MKHSYSLFGEKTDATLARKIHKWSIIFVNTLQLDNTTVPLSDSVKSLSVLLNSTLSMENLSVKPPNPALKNFISQTSKSYYYQLC